MKDRKKPTVLSGGVPTTRREEAHKILVAQIRKRINDTGISSPDLSNNSGNSRTYIQDIFDGSWPKTDERMDRLAEACGCEVAYLLGDENAKTWMPDKVIRREHSSEDIEAKTSNRKRPNSRVNLETFARKNPWPSADGFFEIAPASEPVMNIFDLAGGFAMLVPDEANSPRFRAKEIVFTNPEQPLDPSSFVVLITLEDRAFIGEVVKIDADSVDLRTLRNPLIQTVEKTKIKTISRIIASREP